MNSLAIYLLETTLTLSVLFAFYLIFLRNETFFNLNRWYLLMCTGISFILPLLPVNWNPGIRPGTITILLQTVTISPEKIGDAVQSHFRLSEMVVAVYLIGIALLLARLFFRLLQLGVIVRSSEIREIGGLRVVNTANGSSPFSFLNLIFLNEEGIRQESLATILTHESAHIRQKHSLDLLVTEIAAIFQWFNPVVWLMIRELKTLHEYLADAAVLQNGVSRPAYQRMILDESMGVRVNDLTNQFNVSLLKKRIIMMTKSKSKPWAKGKIVLALPVLAGLTLFLTVNAFSTADSASGGVMTNLNTLTAKPVAMAPLQQKQEKSETRVVPADPAKQTQKTIEKMPVFPGGDEARSKFFAQNVKYPEAAIKNGTQGTVFVSFIIRKDGSVENAKVMRGIGSGCDEEALRVVRMMPKWTPGMDKGKAVDVDFAMPVKFALDCDKSKKPAK